MMYTMPKNFLSICVNFALATQRVFTAQTDKKDRCTIIQRSFYCLSYLRVLEKSRQAVLPLQE